MKAETFNEFMSTVPESPGVYLFKDAEQRVLYVGKASSLKARLRSYTPGPSAPPKSALLSSRASHIETIVTRSDLEALMLEQTLIQKHRPRYNVNWSYPYLEMTVGEEFPRLYFTRKGPRKGSRRYGPFTAGAARRLQRLINQYFRVPSCRVEMDGKQTPCLYHHLNWCDAPCAGRITKERYAGLVAQVKMFLEGRGEELTRQLQKEMDEAAAREDFETAAKVRDRMRAITEILEDQAAIAPGEQDAEVLGLARSGSFACLVLLTIRSGKLTGKQEFTVRRANDVSDGELITSFLGQHFSGASLSPRILLPCPVGSQELVAAWLARRRNAPVELLSPKRGHGRELLKLAEANARASLIVKGRVGGEEAREQLAVVTQVLQLPRTPQRIEAVDLAHLHGEEAVGAIVVFRDGLPSPKEYRKYLIKTARGGDDYEGMREVIRRRLRRLQEEGTPLPDLLLIDGGPGHLHAVSQVVSESGRGGEEKNRGAANGMAMVALAKREETLFLPDHEGPVKLPEDSPALHLLQRARDEVHRYVNAYQRKRRAMALRAVAKS